MPGAATAGLAEDAKVASDPTMELGAKTASAAPLEQLAEAMTAQTIAFFAPPAGHAPTGSTPAVRLAHK